MIRALRQAPTKQSPLVADAGVRAADDLLILRETVAALCERVELLETQVLLARPLLVGRATLTE